jgi:hypothetical protein
MSQLGWGPCAGCCVLAPCRRLTRHTFLSKGVVSGSGVRCHITHLSRCSEGREGFGKGCTQRILGEKRKGIEERCSTWIALGSCLNSLLLVASSNAMPVPSVPILAEKQLSMLSFTNERGCWHKTCTSKKDLMVIKDIPEIIIQHQLLMQPPQVRQPCLLQ